MDTEQLRQLAMTALNILAEYWYVPAIIISLHLAYMLLMDILGLSQPPLPNLGQLKKQLVKAGFAVEQVSGQSYPGILTASKETASTLVVVFKNTVSREEIQEAVLLQQTHCCQRTVVVAREFTDGAWAAAADTEVLLWPSADWQKRPFELAEDLAASKTV